MKRQRGRGRKPGGGGGGGGGSGGGGNHGNRSLESSGPDVKIRGTAAQIYEKYAQLARDSQSGGDRVKYENYLQHAEHYFRIMAATMPREQRLAQQNQEGGFGQHNDQRDGDEGSSSDPLKVVDEADGDDDGDDAGDEVEVRTTGHQASGQGGNQANQGGQSNAPQSNAPQGQDEGGEGEREGRNRRRNRNRNRNRNEEGGADRPERAERNAGGDTEARSALDALAARQAAVAGG